MRRAGRLASCAIIILAAAAIAGCSDDSEAPPEPQATTYRGVFVGTSHAGALSLTLTPTPPLPSLGHLLPPSSGGEKGTITGVFSPDGTGSFPVSGIYDTSKDSIAFTGNGETYYGTLDSDVFPARLVGDMSGIHAGILHCLPDDGTVLVHSGQWSWSPDRYQAPIGFLTRGDEIVGGMITLLAIYPYYGYQITGTLGDGGALRPFTASGGTGPDSMALSGYVDTAVDTAGGTYRNTYPSGTTVTGWWHASVTGPYGIAVARKSPR